MATVRVCDTFVSVQGESSFAGLPCYFIRLAGCNLQCRYCDTPGARDGGREMDVEQLVEMAVAGKAALVEITGGEPLLQPHFSTLATLLRQRRQGPVLVETNGSLDISVIPEDVIAVMDVKCPGSGMVRSFDFGNLDRLRPGDEVKFVISDRTDYEWSCRFVEQHDIRRRCKEVLFSPATGRLSPRILARWIIEDCPPVRLQPRLHRMLGVK